MPRPEPPALPWRGSGGPAQPREQIGEIRGDWRLEAKRLAGQRMFEREPVCVEGLTLELNRPQFVGPVDVPPLTDQRMPAEPRLNADLVAFAGFQTDFEERCLSKLFDDFVVTDGIHSARVAGASVSNEGF